MAEPLVSFEFFPPGDEAMARTLWKPATEVDGVQLADVCAFVTQLDEWRGQYLALVGVPNNFKAEWDFVSAVSACELSSSLVFVSVGC